MLTIALFVVFFALLVLNIPIAIGLGMSSLIGFTFGGLSFDAIAGTMYASLSKFVLLAIPFFILAGNIMEKSGISTKLIDLASSFVGHKKGGLAIVCIIVCCFFAAISGSGPATVAALGVIMIPAMVEIGYKPAFAAALMAAGGAIGVIIPPSIPFVIYGSITNVSIGDLFKSGILPGILVGTILITTALFVTRNEDIKVRPKATWKERTIAFKNAFWGLMMPVIILGGIYGGIFTPTEAAAVAAVYGFIVGFFIYRSLNFKSFVQILRDTVAQTGVIMMIIATASLFAYVLTIDGAARTLTQMLASYAGDSIFKYFIAFNIVLLIAGCFLEATSALYIIAPIFFPVAMQLGIDPIHLGCVMVINLAIGQLTPPVGVNLFVACGIGKVSIKEITVKILPLVGIFIVALLMITYIPQICLALV